MSFPFYIARRYLIAKKSHNIINLISFIAIGGVTIGTMALIVALSAFNGLEDLVLTLYNAFDPDIKIIAAEGKTFNPAVFPSKEISGLKGVAYYTSVLEENALRQKREKHQIATIKGVSDEFLKRNGFEERMVAGDFSLYKDSVPLAILGYDIAYKLSLNLGDMFHPVNLYIPKRNISSASIDPSGAFNQKAIMAGGIFSIQQDFDTKYVIVPLKFARELLGMKNNLSSIEITLDQPITPADAERTAAKIRQIAGNDFTVQDRSQQHELLYKIMKSEKWAVFFILTFILIIATFNIIGSLTMLIYDKRNDIAILRSMGADSAVIRKLFFLEGIFISLIGNILGLMLGCGVCWLQLKYKIISFSANIIIDSYPVKMEISDFVYVFLTVFFIGFLATYFPVKQIAVKYSLIRNE